MNLENDIAASIWFVPGNQNVAAIYNTKVTPNYEKSKEILDKTIVNFRKFYERWNDYFMKYAKLVEKHLGPGLLEKIKYNQQFITGFIDYQTDPDEGNVESVRDKIKGWALFSRQSGPKWFYGSFCDIYNFIVEKLLNKSDFKLATNKLCNMFDSRTAESYKIFMAYPNVDELPPTVSDENYNNDCKKIMDFYGTTELSEIPKTSDVAKISDLKTSKFSKTFESTDNTKKSGIPQINATTIAVIIIIIIILIVAVSAFIVFNFKLFKKYNTAPPRQNVLKNKN